MPTFRIPTPLRPYSGGNSQVQVSGDTVDQALADLTSQYPGLRQHLFIGGDLRSLQLYRRRTNLIKLIAFFFFPLPVQPYVPATLSIR